MSDDIYSSLVVNLLQYNNDRVILNLFKARGGKPFLDHFGMTEIIITEGMVGGYLVVLVVSKFLHVYAGLK